MAGDTFLMNVEKKGKKPQWMKIIVPSFPGLLPGGEAPVLRAERREREDSRPTGHRGPSIAAAARQVPPGRKSGGVEGK